MKRLALTAAAVLVGACSTSDGGAFLEDTCDLTPVTDDFARAAGAAAPGAWQETLGPGGDGVTLSLAAKDGRPAPSLAIETSLPSATARARTWSRPLANGSASGCAELVVALRVDAVEGGAAGFASLRFAGGASYALRITPDLALVLVERGATAAEDHELARAPLAKGTWTTIDLLAWSGAAGATPPVLQLDGRTVETALPARARGAIESVTLGLEESGPSPRASFALDDLDVR